MKKEDKKEWLIKYAKKNGLEEILNDKYHKQTTVIKRYSSEIQAISSLLSVLFIGIVSLLFSFENNRIADMQLSVAKSEVKPIVVFSYEKDIFPGIDRIKINNAGTTPLNYDVEVVSFFNVLANENSMGSIPIRVYTLNGVCSYNNVNDAFENIAEIDIYSETSDFVSNIRDGLIEITTSYTDLYWDIIHTYIIKITCLDSLNETSEFYYIYDKWGGKVILQDKGQKIFQEYENMIPSEGSGHYTSKESYFDLKDTTSDLIFRYALQKIRAEGLYKNNLSENKIVQYGDYEPQH